MARRYQPINLTSKDRAILAALQADSSESSHELAERLGMSQSTLWRRVKELENAGAIERRVAILDPDVVGAPVCAYVFVNLSSYEPKIVEGFRQLLHETEEILECYSITGAFDHLLSVRTADVHSLKELLLERIAMHPSVADTSSHMTLERLKFTTAIPLGA